MVVVFRAVHAHDAARRLSSMSAREIARRVESRHQSIGIAGYAAALGLVHIVRWACTGVDFQTV